MTLPVPIPFVADLLGHSTIYEEQRGDFVRAQQIAAQQLVAAQQAGDPRQLADALLARGVVHLLQGEVSSGLTCLEAAQQQAAGDPARQVRALAYSFQAVLLGYNLFPDWAAASSQEINARINLVAYAKTYSQQYEPLEQLVSDSALRLELRLLGKQQTVQLGRHAIGAALKSSIEIRQGLATNMLKARDGMAADGASPQLCALLDLQSADLLFGAYQREQAAELLDRAGTLYDQHNDPVGVANCLMKCGDWMVAPFSTPLAWNCSIQESLNDNTLRWEIEAEEAADNAANVAHAHSVYAEAEKHFRSGGAPRGLAAIQLRYGYLATIERDDQSLPERGYERGSDHAARARDLYAAAGDWLGVRVAEAHLALCRVGMGRLPEDSTTATAIGNWGRSTGSFSFTLGLGLLFARVGRRWLVRDGDFERAMACFRLAEALFHGLDAKLSEAKSVTDQSNVYELIGERNAFVVNAERALDICKAIIDGQPALAGPGWQQANETANKLFQMANARADADGIVRLVERLKELVERAPGANLQRTTEDKGHSPESLMTQALALLQQARDQTEDDDYGQTMILIAAGMTTDQLAMAKFLEPLYRGKQARDAGDDEQARFSFERALEVAHQDPGPNRLFQEAMVLGYLRRNDEAAAIFRDYLAYQQHQLTQYRERETPPELLRDMERSAYKQALMTFANTRHYAEAQAFLEALEQLDGPCWWLRDGTAWENLTYAGEIAEGLGDWPRALSYYEQAMEAFERQRRQLTSDELKTALASGSSVQFMYFDAARTALKAREAALAAGDASGAQAAMERAFSAIERGKARSLLDLMVSGAMADGISSAEDQNLRAWRRLNAYLTTRRGLLAFEHAQRDQDQQRIDALRREIAVTEQELDGLEARLTASDSRFSMQKAHSQVLSLAAVSSALPADAALLQYAFLGDDLLAWAITQQGVAAVHRMTTQTNKLKRQMREFHHSCEQRQAPDELGRELARALLTPFDQILQAYSQLIVVPYSTAHLLPFHALPWRDQLLAVSHRISYLPSASLIQFLDPNPDTRRATRVLAVGNPAQMRYRAPGRFELEALQALPEAATEATYIASLFPGSKALIGTQATAVAVRAELGNYPLLHFATHGHLDPDVPLLSSIMLANGAVLTVYELMGLRIDADLVVLSACRTGQGEMTGGDDVLGLTRGLLGAGARAAVVSLWPVDDVSTSVFMGEFYRQLQAGRDPSAALQAAQKFLCGLTPEEINVELVRLQTALQAAGAAETALQPVIREHSARHVGDEQHVPAPADYSHPYYWAPFILVG